MSTVSAGVPMSGVGNAGRGLGAKTVFIRSVDASQDQVLATDANGAQIELPYTVCRTGLWPVAGQTWIADRALGPWTLAARIGGPDPAETDPPDVDEPADVRFHAAASVVDLGGGLLGARFAHGASFTPSGGVPVSYDGPSVTNSWVFQVYSLDATYLTVEVRHADGTSAAVGELVECFGIVWP